MHRPAEAKSILKRDAVKRSACIDVRTIFGRTISTDCIKVLKRQTHGVRDLVTPDTHRLGRMSIKTLANSFKIRIGSILNNGEIHIARWIGYFLAQKHFTQSLAAQRGRRPAWMRVQGYKAHLRENARMLRTGGILIGNPIFAETSERHLIHSRQFAR